VGSFGVYFKYEVAEYVVFKLEDLVNKIVPFFDKYSIIGVKSLDYLDLKKAIELIKNKEHLTVEGLNKISGIIKNMNKERDSSFREAKD